MGRATSKGNEAISKMKHPSDIPTPNFVPGTSPKMKMDATITQLIWITGVTSFSKRPSAKLAKLCFGL